ncbi:MAG: hypothetical protein ACOX6I_00830 [Syntrophomonadaceae bacterium]|jgi:hypothetical protein
MEENKFLELLGVPSTILGSKEWKDLEARENAIGPDQLLTEITQKKLWSNEEIAWVLRRMIFFYGKKDSLLKKAPVERIFMNMVDVLRVFFIIFDKTDPELDENIRSYISTKLVDATWGINSRTRDYLYKLK